MDGWGWGAGGSQASRRGKGKDLVLWAWLSARCRGHAAREQAGAIAETLAAVGGRVGKGNAPPSPRGKRRRRPGPAPDSLWG